MRCRFTVTRICICTIADNDDREQVNSCEKKGECTELLVVALIQNFEFAGEKHDKEGKWEEGQRVYDID